MKTLLILLLIVFCLGESQAQVSNNEIIVAKYEMTFNSPLISEMVRKSAPSPDVFASAMNEIEKTKVWYKLYVFEDGFSTYTIDTLFTNKKVSILGYPTITNYQKDSLLYGEELLFNDIVRYTANSNDYHWIIADSIISINGYNCHFAQSSYFPGLKVWFTTDVMLNHGPAYIQGLPGLIVKFETDFDVTNLLSIQKVPSTDELEKIKDTNVMRSAQDDKKRKIDLSVLIKRKSQFKNQIQKSVESSKK